MASTVFQDALNRMGGMYGSAMRDGFVLQEAIEVTGNVAVARVEVPLVGQTRMGYKAGRETREGTMRIQLIDSTWAVEIYQFLGQSLVQRRAARGTPSSTIRAFDLQLKIDDPEALDYEAWQLTGVQVWQMPVGFSITDDVVQREIPITWETETPLHVFLIDRNGVNGATDVTDTLVSGNFANLPAPAGRY